MINEKDIEKIFAGSNFGGSEKTDIGRRGLMVDCILQYASGYSSGHTITTICKEAGLLPESLVPTQDAIRWAFMQLYQSGGKTILERLYE